MPLRRKFVWHAGASRIELGEKTLVMGIVNATPDSFSGDGVRQGTSREKVPGLRHARQLVRDGADMIDIGGESTRPGARAVSVKEEVARVVPLIRALAGSVNIPVSVDTRKPEVASQALAAGASIVNLVQGTPADRRILERVARYGAGLVLMHMRGTPRTMQRHCRYGDVVLDVRNELKKSLDICSSYGIKKASIVVDPGIGFSKTAGQNLVLLKRLRELSALSFPVLVGTSRKSFIGKALGVDVEGRLTGTVVTCALAIASGAHILRVHDVKVIKQAARMADEIVGADQSLRLK